MKSISKLFVVFILASCSKTEPTIFNSLESSQTGVDFINDLKYTPSQNIIEYLYYYNGGGVAVGDINNDGLEDIYFTANQKSNALYLNKGNFQFEDISFKAGIDTSSHWSTGAIIVDVNGDGYRDIFECNVGNYKSFRGSNKLYINNGDLTFTESAAKWGLLFSGFSTHSAFLDYDHDGDLDMYLLNHSIHTPRSYGTTDTRTKLDSLAGDRFYENLIAQGENKFIDATEKAGIYSSALGYGLGITTLDVNQDGWLDIYVGNDFHENDYLYINQADGTFKESLEEYIGHTSRFTMGVDAGDLNNDGLPDILSLDMMPEDPGILLKSGGEDANQVLDIKEKYGFGPQFARNAIQINKGNGTFAELGLKTNLYATDWSWSVLTQDFNLDGFSDVFVSNGIYKRPNDLDYINYLSNFNFQGMSGPEAEQAKKEIIEKMPSIKISNKYFEGRGDLIFEDMEKMSGLSEPSFSNGAAFSDLDNDGDLDIVVNNVNQPAGIFKNNSSDESNFLKIKLIGEQTNIDAIGSRVAAYSNGSATLNEVSTSRGFQSSSTYQLHFGLPRGSKFDSAIVFWPDGSRQSITSTLQGFVEIQKNGYQQRPQSSSILKTGLDIIPFVHKEDDYQDYNSDHLIPYSISKEGPAVVAADFNQDGFPDLFLGGALGQASAVLVGREDGGYIKVENSELDKDKSFEDVSAAAADFDNDGDLDLYVVSGGNKFQQGDYALEDRIYINNGKGVFTRLKLELPRSNGSVVLIEDLNGDANLEIFVGGRNVPGSYGYSTESYLLSYQEEKVAIIAQWKLGMITDAALFDHNKDSYKDIVFVGHWMKPQVLLSKAGSFDSESKPISLSDDSGWWNSIDIGDLNGDQEADLILGNFGLNSRVTASHAQPMKLFLDDFDGNGQGDPIIFHHFNGEFIPLASRDDLIKQIPSIKKRFVSYQSFSKIRSIEELTGKSPTAELEVNQLNSMILFGGQESAIPMPDKAQWSSVNSALSVDVDLDGDLDLLSVGNFFGGLSQFGRMDGSNGALFLNDGNGNFKFDNWLPIPNEIEIREVIKIDDNRILFVPNNSSPFVLTIELLNQL